MPKKTVNQYERAYRAWPILVEHARIGKPIAYGGLGKLLGIHQKPVRFVLAKIQAYCQEQDLPPLTILVEDLKGNVGAGFIAWAHNNLEAGRKLVYDFPWRTLPNPFAFAADGTTPESIAKDIAENRKDADEKFAQVKVRGVAQQIFRNVMLKLYGGRCAISGDGGEPLLQAAHIMPWGKATPSQKRSPTNGILLSLTHHRMFDLDWIRVTQGYRVKVNRLAFRGETLSTVQREALNAIDGQKIRLPDKEENWPDKTLLAQRYASPKIRKEAKKEALETAPTSAA
jgi:putative restriction endonuclease